MMSPNRRGLNCVSYKNKIVGSGALSGKMLLAKIIENNKIGAFILGQVRVSLG